MSCSLDREEAVNLKQSLPMQVAVSSFIRGQVPFNKIVSTQDIATHGSQIILSKKFKVGQSIEAKYLGNGLFSLIEDDKKKFQKGDLVTVRYVKNMGGRGITVQLDTNQFGFIEVCEITDEISSNVIKYASEK